MKRTVLVTGSSGFLAGHLIGRVRDCGWAGEVRGADARDGGPDVADAASLGRLLAGVAPDLVFHLASPPPSAPLDELIRVNEAGTRTLLETLARLDPMPRVLVAGSAAEYGAVAEGESPVREDTPLRPLGPYGISKAAQTAVCMEEARRTGIPVIVFRPFNVIGPGMPAHLAFGSFARQIARAERGEGDGVLRVGPLGGTRDFVDARDVVEALLLLAVSGRPGGAYNICTGGLRSVREGLELLLGMSTAAVRVDEDAGSRGAGPPGFAGDPSKIARDTGWRASIPFRRSLGDLLEAARRSAAE